MNRDTKVVRFEPASFAIGPSPFIFNWPEGEMIIENPDDVKNHPKVLEKYHIVLAEAERAMEAYKLSSWSFAFDRAKRRCGRCSWRKKRISLSGYHVAMNKWAELGETILHEIAHALTPGHGHDRVWRACALRIGSNGKRLAGEETEVPKRAFALTCPACSKQYRKAHRRRKVHAYCSACYYFNNSIRNESFRLEWRKNENL